MTSMLTETMVLDALERAAAAHGVHEAEELGGVYDDEWPSWYAAHMAHALAGHGLDAEALKTTLEQAAAAHGQHEAETGAKDADWPRWYAAYMTPLLTR